MDTEGHANASGGSQDLMTYRDFAAFMGVGPKKVRQLVRKGRLRTVDLDGSKRILRSEKARFIQEWAK